MKMTLTACLLLAPQIVAASNHYSNNVGSAQRAVEHDLMPQSGEYFVWDADGAGLSGFSLYIDGDAAQDLYDRMDVEPIMDECVGGVTKIQHRFSCNKQNASTHRCSVGLDLDNGTLDWPDACFRRNAKDSR